VIPHSPHSPYLAASDLQLFGAHQDAIFGIRFGIVDEVTEEVSASTTLQPGTRLGSMLLVLAGATVLNFMEMCSKMCVIRTSVFKDLGKKLLAVKNCYKTFWTTFLFITMI
jgi:hypothetical protein